MHLTYDPGFGVQNIDEAMLKNAKQVGPAVVRGNGKAVMWKDCSAFYKTSTGQHWKSTRRTEVGWEDPGEVPVWQVVQSSAACVSQHGDRYRTSAAGGARAREVARAAFSERHNAPGTGTGLLTCSRIARLRSKGCDQVTGSVSRRLRSRRSGEDRTKAVELGKTGSST